MKIREVNVICYELVEPIVYNKGTKWEKTCSEFLKSYAQYMTEEELKKRIDDLNNQPVKMEEGKEVKRYFIDKQREMY